MAEELTARVQQLVDFVTRMAAGDLNASLEPSERGDEIDALTEGLNMLAEELSFSTSQLRTAMRELEALRALLPICAWCRNVRDDRGEWTAIEKYVASRTGRAVTHGICPRCADEHFDDAGD